MTINKIIIWGLEENSHTHAYIHSGFFKAFKHLGYDVFWFPDNNKNDFDFSHSLFITVGIADSNIPIRLDCYYILHNCTDMKYKPLYDMNRCISIAVSLYEYDNFKKTYVIDNPYIYGINNTLYVHWMTDLLPYEIDENINNFVDYENKKKVCSWIGSYNNCPRFGNYTEINPFVEECKKNNIPFFVDGMYTSATVKNDIAINIIKNSLIAPAINGIWQKEVGYIPCRIFKNISYGTVAGTNNRRVYELFKNKIPFDENTSTLFYKTLDFINDIDSKKNTIELMKMVRDNFTYINLISYMLDFFHTINDNFSYIK